MEKIARIDECTAAMGPFYVGLELYKHGLISYEEFRRDYPGCIEEDL